MPRLRCLSVVMMILIAPLVYSAAPKNKMTPHCKDKEMACYVNAKCATNGRSEEAVLNNFQYDDACDVHVELRPYSTKKALIRLRAKKGPIKLSYQETSTTKEIFGCEEIGVDKFRRTPADSGKELIHGEKWQGGIACEFLFESSEQDDLFDNNKELVVSYGTDKVTGDAGEFGKAQNIFKKATKCDIDWLSDVSIVNATFIYSEPDKYFNDVVCPSGTLVFVDEDDEDTVTEAASIKCENAIKQKDKWQYTISSKESPETIVVANKDAIKKVGCQSKVCTQCTSIPSCSSSPNGSRSKRGECKAAQIVTEKDGCKVLKCGDKKHRFIKINDDDPTEGHAECGQDVVEDEDDEGETKKTFEWKFNDIAVAKAECIAHCQDINPLTIDKNNARGLNLSNLTLQCSAGLISFDDGAPTAPSTFKTIECDLKTGSWKAGGEGGVAVPKGTKLSCQAPFESTTGANGNATANASFGPLEYVAGAIGFIILLIVIGIIVYCLTCKKQLDKKKNAKKIKTITSSRLTKSEDNLKTAVPVGYAPPSSGSQKPTPEPLVEKTMVAVTPDKQPSVMMKTAILDLGDDESTYAKDNVSKNVFGKEMPMRNLKDVDKKEQSDGSEPQSIKIGKDGEILLRKKKKNRSKGGPKSEEKSEVKSEVKSQSDPGTTKKEDRPPKKEEKKKEEKKEEPPSGPMPQTFALNEKEEKIRKGATKKQADYPTMEDIMSDWSDSEECRDYKKAYDKGPLALEEWKRKKAEKERKKKGSKNTVPTAVTPDQPPTVERTQATRTRNSVDKGEDANMENLLTQMDTTVEQKEADAKRK